MPLPKVTTARVESWLKDRELNYKIDDDGDLAAGFDEVIMFVHVEERLLRAQGYWVGRFNPETDLRRVQEVANEMNSQVIIPKTLAVPNRGTVVFETSVYVDEGLTDKQLTQALDGVFTSTFQVAEKVGEKLPDLMPAKENN